MDSGSRGRAGPHVRTLWMAASFLAAWLATAHAADLNGDIATACRADFSAHCSGVEHGTPQAMACLQADAQALVMAG